MTPRFANRLTAIILLLLAAILPATGQVRLDGTLGPSGPLTGPNYSIPDTVGRTVGNNLFHSFSQFNLATGESATFSGPANIRNVISRVTGGSPSSIDGTIYCAIDGANFFFINPFGVIFGPNAQVNVSGSLVVSTADYVKLADGGRFDARNPANDILTVAPVSAFGFLGPAAAGIQINGPPPDQPASAPIQLSEGKTLALIGGDIRIANTTISAPAGRAAFVSIASAGELAFDADDLSSPVDTRVFSRLANLTLTDYTMVDVSGNGGGRLILQGDNVTAENQTYLMTMTYGDGMGLGADIQARTSIRFLQSFIYGMTWSDGDSGDIKLTAPLIQLDGQGGGAGVCIGTYGTGRAGDIFITADSLRLINGGNMDSSTGSPSDGGNINVTARTVTLDGQGNVAWITSVAYDQGKAGTISIQTESLTIDNNAFIMTDTYQLGDGGRIAIETGTLRIGELGEISSSTHSSGQGGSITITADSLAIDGHGFVNRPIGISARGSQDGNGGDITIRAGLLTLQNNAQITTSTTGSPFSTGDAGNIDIHVRDLTLDSNSSITSAAGDAFGGTGKAGSIAIRADNAILIQNNAAVSVAAAYNDGGNIYLSAGTQIRLDHGLISAAAYGDGGNVYLTTTELVYLFYSQILAKSITGNGGNITIDPQFVILDHSSLVASAILGHGGNITIVCDYFLQQNSTIDVSSEFGVEGSVSIAAPSLELKGNIIALPADLLDPRMLLLPNCSERAPGGTSSFFLRGRGGAPSDPNLLLPLLPRVGGDNGK